MTESISDTNVQTMRDQGISDACNGYPAFAMLADGELLVADPCGVHVPLSDDGSDAWREAFAYARAYEANAELDDYWCDCSPNCGHVKSA